MATGSRYFVPFRRRREGKTDYYKRTSLVVADAPRMVVRRTNRDIIIQLVTAEMDGDRALVAANSAELEHNGTRDQCQTHLQRTSPACSLPQKQRKQSFDRAILDIGLSRATKGARVFAALKGAVEAGLDVPHGEEILPSDERAKGAHIAAYNKNAGDVVKMVELAADAIKKEMV